HHREHAPGELAEPAEEPHVLECHGLYGTWDEASPSTTGEQRIARRATRCADVALVGVPPRGPEVSRRAPQAEVTPSSIRTSAAVKTEPVASTAPPTPPSSASSAAAS